MAKKTIKMNEAQLRDMVTESVKKALSKNDILSSLELGIGNVMSKQDNIEFRLDSLLKRAIDEALQCGKWGHDFATDCYNNAHEELLQILKEFNLV